MSEITPEDQVQDQLDLDIVKKRSVTGVLAIGSRTFFLQGLAVIANFLLTVFLLPQEYGIFFAISAIIEFFVIFSDVGLAAALIQKKHSLNEKDLKTTFTVQQILVNLLVLLALVFSGLIGKFYNLSLSGLWLFRVLAISLSLASLKTIPAIKLERKLEFSKLVIPQIIENVLFYATAVFLAWKGYGVTSFTWAVLLRGVSGLVAIYLLSPWRPAFAISRQVIKKLFSFGIPFQINTVIAFIKDKLIIAYLFKVLSPTEVGYIAWGQKWSHYPLQLVMESLNKVTFPSYSRLQSKKEFLKKAIEKSLFFTSLFIFPMVVGLVAIASSFVRLMPRYQQWTPALITLSLFSITAMWSSISTSLINALAAIGKIVTNLKLMIMWTVLTWLLTPLLVINYGYIGAALASAVISFTSIIPIIIIKKVVKINIAPSLLPSLISSLIMGSISYYLAQKAETLVALGTVVVISVILYLGLSFILQKDKIMKEIRLIISIIRAK